MGMLYGKFLFKFFFLPLLYVWKCSRSAVFPKYAPTKGGVEFIWEDPTLRALPTLMLSFWMHSIGMCFEGLWSLCSCSPIVDILFFKELALDIVRYLIRKEGSNRSNFDLEVLEPNPAPKKNYKK
jgi:hypothetical protein